MIPKILHSIWVGGATPNINFSTGWGEIMPTWDIIHWDDRSILAEFREDPVLQLLISSGVNNTYISDYVRILILEKYGGFYSDIDVEFLKDIEEFTVYPGVVTYQFPQILSKTEIVTPLGLNLRNLIDTHRDPLQYFSKKEYLNNNFIGTHSNSDFIRLYKQAFIDNFTKPLHLQFSYIDYGCGPRLLTDFASKYVLLDGNRVTCDIFTAFENTIFHPTNYLDDKHATSTGKINYSKQRNIALALGSYSVHYQISQEVKK